MTEEKKSFEDSGSGSGTGTIEQFSDGLIVELEREIEALKQENFALRDKDTICVVYPYLKDAAQGEELKLSLRSLEKNFKEKFMVVIVGDYEPWMSSEIWVIPSKGTSHKDGDQPKDIALKLSKVIAEARVPENFVWMNDDIYFINPVMLADIQTLKAMEDLGKIKRESGTPYRKNLWKTYDKLISMGIKTVWNYGTHLPFCFNKQKLAEMIDKFNMLKESYLTTTLYHNIFFKDFRPMLISAKWDNMKIGIYKPWKSINKTLFEQFITEKKFLNNSQTGFDDEIMKLLKKMFPDKSRFEK